MGVSLRQTKKGDGWWIYIRRNGRRKCKFVKDKQTAVRLTKELRSAFAAGDLGLADPIRTLPTFKTFAEAFLTNAAQTLKRSTLEDYQSSIRRHLIPAFGERHLDQITRADVKQLAFAIRAKGRKPKTARKVVGTLSSILNDAVDDGLIASNPALGLRKVFRSPDFRDNATKAPITPLTREELTHLLATARTHSIQRGTKTVFPYRAHYPFLLLLARTGVRLGEGIGLQWGDIDWRGGFLEVRRAYVRGRLTSTKNKMARRVDMSQQLQETLRALYTERFDTVVAMDAEQQAAWEYERANAATQWVFPDTRGGVLDGDAFRSRVFGPLLVAAKMRHIRIHDLRHGYASQLLAAGKELHFVQQQLGHHSPAFTLAVYGHLLPRDRRGEVNCLDEPMPVAAPSTGEAVTSEPTPIRRAG